MLVVERPHGLLILVGTVQVQRIQGLLVEGEEVGDTNAH